MNDTAPNVIVIPAKVETPQEQEKKRHLRVAAYCRVSTDSEEQLSSYENQLSYYTEKIMKEPGWTMAGVFADEGITGTSTCKRKEFLRMIRQCRQGKIDMILATVLRGVRDGLPAVRVDSARSQAPRMAVRQPPGLWEEVLYPIPHPGRGTAPAGHPGRRQCRHAGPRYPGPAAYRRHGVGAGPDAG